MAAPFVVQAGGRTIPTLLAGLAGGAGAAYAPKLLSSESDASSQLAQALAALRHPSPSPTGVTVVTSPAPASSSATVSTTVTVVCVAGVGYCVMKLSGVSLSGLLWVTRRAWKKSVQELSKGLDHLQDSIEKVRNQFLSRVADLSGKQDKMAAAQASMASDLSQLDVKVDVLGEGVNRVKGVVDLVAGKIDGMESRIEDLASKHDRQLLMLEESQRGIRLLCSVVNNTIENRETTAEEARLIREFADSESVAKAIEDVRRDASGNKLSASWREMMPRSPIAVPAVGLACGAQLARGWK